MDKIFLTIREAAKILEIEEATLIHLIQHGVFQEFVDRTTTYLKQDQVLSYKEQLDAFIRVREQH